MKGVCTRGWPSQSARYTACVCLLPLPFVLSPRPSGRLDSHAVCLRAASAP